MPNLRETAYPCFKSDISPEDLDKIYTPTKAEVVFANNSVRKRKHKVFFLVLLKSVQRLGYFVSISSVPTLIVKHIAKCLNQPLEKDTMMFYDRSRKKKDHIRLIRDFLGIKSYRDGGNEILEEALSNASLKKDELVDIINIGIEELIRNRYELPVFENLVRKAKTIRVQINEKIYQQIYEKAGEKGQAIINDLLKIDPETKRTPWNVLRSDIGKASLKELKELINRLDWLRRISCLGDSLNAVSYTKIRHLSLEAKSLDAARVRTIKPYKLTALASALVKTSLADVVDDLCEMMIKKMGKIHSVGKQKLSDYLEENQDTMDGIITSFKEIHEVFSSNTSGENRLDNIKNIFDQRPEQIQYSEYHALYGGKNYYRFLRPLFRSSRSTFFEILSLLDFVSTSSDKSLEQAILYARSYRHSKSEWISLDAKDKPSLEDLTWIPDRWWYLVTGKKRRKDTPDKINRWQFEVCLFSQIVQELKSADICVPDSDQFVDFREQLISWDEYKKKLPRYGEFVGLPIEPKSFILHIQKLLQDEAEKLNNSYPENKEFNILKNGELSLKKLNADPIPEGLVEIEKIISERLPPRNILDILSDTQNLLDWSRVFGPISGLKSKLKNPDTGYVISSFCYGCNLGPTQTSRSLPVLDPRQIAWINQRHITEESLQKAIEIIINAYNKFTLPKFWGDGSSASADGTKWDLYDNNLLSEYHIRYGGYGGIGYYHVSDQYIALFSRFIPCGVYEAVYILDMFFENRSEIQPDQIHADTHGQSLAVFGLAYLLGIQLMPRIARWKDLKIYRPSNQKYPHIDQIFTHDAINWELIEKHIDDLFRVAISIQEGRISPSVILRRLGTYSRKNKLYFAFQELRVAGRLVRLCTLRDFNEAPI